jgi:glutathione peroxidase
LQKIATASLSLIVIASSSPVSAASVPDGIGSIPVQFDGVAKPIGESLGKKGTLVVNVASQCALTPQYEDLVTLYKTYEKDGFTILAFPCNQFGNQVLFPPADIFVSFPDPYQPLSHLQEPEDDIKRIRKNMLDQFGVTFPIFDKVEVNGAGQVPLYTKLKSYEGIGTSNVAKIR